MNPETYRWYEALEKPFFAPPSWLFGPVWSVLYFFIALSFGYVFVKVIKKEWPPMVVVPFIVNLVSNAAFTPLQFGLRSNGLAAVDICIVLVSIIWMMRSVWHKSRLVAYVQIPYLLWVSFATILQLSITWLNR